MMTSCLGMTIREIRAVRGLQQADFARVLQVSRQYVSQVEHGKCKASEEFIDKMKFTLKLNSDEIEKLEFSRAVSDKQIIIATDGLSPDTLKLIIMLKKRNKVPDKTVKQIILMLSE